MDVHSFIRTRPCLEECEGYLEGLHDQIANRDKYQNVAVQYEQITDEVMAPLRVYMKRLREGKEIPAPSRCERRYRYFPNRKPQRR